MDFSPFAVPLPLPTMTTLPVDPRAFVCRYASAYATAFARDSRLDLPPGVSIPQYVPVSSGSWVNGC